MKEIYLDYNATSPPHPEVLEIVESLLSTEYQNPSAVYARRSRELLDEARYKTSLLLGCEAGEIVFTSGGTESNNLAIKGAFHALKEKGKRHIVTTAVEHPSVLEVCRALEREGAQITVLPVDANGQVEPSAVHSAIRPDTALVTIVHANSETGTIQLVREIQEICRRRGVLFHIDGVQSAGKMRIDVDVLGCDLYSISGHKFGGLKGAGALYVRKGTELHPLILGGEQERGLRGGTENLPGILALGKASEVALRDLERNLERWEETRHIFEGLAERVPYSRINGHPTDRVPNTLNICFLYAEAVNVVLALALERIYVGTGSACRAGKMEPSPVLKAMGLNRISALCSVRISTGPELTAEEARYSAQRIAETVERIRSVSAPETIGECDQNCPCFFEEQV